MRPVPDQTTAAKVRTDTEDKLWEALHANPNSTAAELSVAAKIGKSTAQKILAHWAGDGSVTRTAGIAEGGRRAADLWAITEAENIVAECAPVNCLDDADHIAAVPATSDGPEGSGTRTLTEGDATEEANTEPCATPADDAQDMADNEAEPATAGVAEGPNDSAATDTGTSTAGDGRERSERLASGALRGMVEDYLRDHPGEEFGPTAIAKALGGKSSGAVSNALDKLVESKTAVKTKDKPRRFALAPTEAATASTPTK
ncbi:MarR family transcriptional regulator [Amycolatopsis rhizosphaerae]|uniref:MarR family transcriptional regulator n=1 Tax=Amycolatopsis rhizosphaerae TaxID=2053003 RepID=UPI001FEB82FF|nr:helix-turn-helix domain-containing protein [Amycolatopsis rhizosphaerae]